MTDEERRELARVSFLAGVSSMNSRGNADYDLDKITRETYTEIFNNWWNRSDL